MMKDKKSNARQKHYQALKEFINKKHLELYGDINDAVSNSGNNKPDKTGKTD